jgi:predicted transcriptional regulator of viral defense system
MEIEEMYNETSKNCIKARDLSTWLLSNGVSSATTAQIAVWLGVPLNHVPQRLAPLQKRGLIVSPARGLWIPVSPEFTSWGAPPAIDIIDQTMSYLNADYYVGWLSAAALYGASHHAPQVFQVAASRTIRNRNVGRSKMQFYHRSHIGSVPVTYKETRSGSVIVATPVTTLLDIASDLQISGGINNVANIVIELCEENTLNMNLLANTASLYPTSTIRRLGWLLESYTDVDDTEQLRALSVAGKRNPSKLLPAAKTENLNDRWNIFINAKVEADV